MPKVFLGIGGNIGDRKVNFTRAYERIENELGNIIDRSSVYETPPWGFHAEENFWNQVLLIETDFSPELLLVKIWSVENLFLRDRGSGQYASREMDIDILYYDDLYIETETLIIPHPRMHKRLFVLVPLTEIAAGFKHPLLRMTSLQMLENCKDTSVIRKVDGF